MLPCSNATPPISRADESPSSWPQNCSGPFGRCNRPRGNTRWTGLKPVLSLDLGPVTPALTAARLFPHLATCSTPLNSLGALPAAHCLPAAGRVGLGQVFDKVGRQRGKVGRERGKARRTDCNFACAQTPRVQQRTNDGLATAEARKKRRLHVPASGPAGCLTPSSTTQLFHQRIPPPKAPWMPDRCKLVSRPTLRLRTAWLSRAAWRVSLCRRGALGLPSSCRAACPRR